MFKLELGFSNAQRRIYNTQCYRSYHITDSYIHHECNRDSVILSQTSDDFICLLARLKFVSLYNTFHELNLYTTRGILKDFSIVKTGSYIKHNHVYERRHRSKKWSWWRARHTSVLWTLNSSVQSVNMHATWKCFT